MAAVQTTDTDPLLPAERSCPRCQGEHLSWTDAARCRWERAAVLSGSGPWAATAHCSGHRDITVRLHRTEREACVTLSRWDTEGCCTGTCNGLHALTFLDCPSCPTPAIPVSVNETTEDTR